MGHHRRIAAGCGAILLVVLLLFVQTSCTMEDPAEEAFRNATEDSESRPLEQVEAELQEIVRRWPESRAAEKAGHEIEWIHEQQAVEQRGPSLLAWDAVRKVGTAAERFKLRHGHFPGSFDGLVPGYLDGVVRDPWGFEVVYQKTERGYHVICYGEDGLPGGVDLATDLLIDSGQVVGIDPALQ